ncbi:MAG TPA: ATP-binding protein [Thermoanaerobaculia bacterium]|nr:ATP-binding protein [Thermoanaerobaculia bacterium]
MRNPIVIEVADSSAVGEVRRAAVTVAQRVSLSDDAVGRVSLVVTEMATNIVKHATSGMFLIGVDGEDETVLEILALDTGPGIHDISQALRDGHSTTGTPGTGLGAAARHASFFQLDSRPDRGTAVVARFARDANRRLVPRTVGVVSIPFPGETVNGDGWYLKGDGSRRFVMVVDGLGHGPEAHEAAVKACAAFEKTSEHPPAVMTVIHDALRATRGAAVAVAEIDGATLRFCGVGNISATMIDATARRSAVSLHGIVGHQMREAREFTYPWTPDSTLIMHSDGLTTRWDLDAYPGLLGRDAVLIAGVLWKDHRRRNDDSTVLVLQARR